MNESRLKTLIFFLLFTTAVFLSTAYLLVGRPLGIVAVIGIAAVWGILLWRNGRALSWPMLLLAISAALAHLPNELVNTDSALVWSYLGIICNLLVWDLSRLQQRLADSQYPQPLIIAHSRRLGLLVVLSLVALALQQLLPLSFNFDYALISGLILVIGLQALLRRLQQQEITKPE